MRALLVADTRSLVAELRFAGLVAIAGGPNPIPFRTRPLNSPAPMILSLKAWESRSLPGLPSADQLSATGDSRRWYLVTEPFLRVTFSSAPFKDAAPRGGVLRFWPVN